MSWIGMIIQMADQARQEWQATNPEITGGSQGQFGGVTNPEISSWRRGVNTGLDPAGLFGGIGPGSADYEEEHPDYGQMFRAQFEALREVYPGVGAMDDIIADIYGNPQAGSDLYDFLFRPAQPTSLEAQLPEFFGLDTSQGSGYFRGHQAGPAGPLSGQGYPMLQDYTGRIEEMFPTATDLYQTGFRTDIQPALDYANWYLTDQAIPAIGERFGSNIFGSGFNQATNDAGRQLAAELGLQQIALDEAAAGRRLQGLPQALDIFGRPLRAATEFATLGSQAGANYRRTLDYETNPGYRLLQAMPTLAGVSSSQSFFQPGYPTSGTDLGNMYSALGQTGPGIGSGLASLFGNLWNTPGAGGYPFSYQSGPVQATQFQDFTVTDAPGSIFGGQGGSAGGGGGGGFIYPGGGF